jgi:hypothetical protein
MDNRSDINTGGWDHPIGRECHVMSNAYCISSEIPPAATSATAIWAACLAVGHARSPVMAKFIC